MRYEQKKEISALLSIGSVLIVILASLLTFFEKDGLLSQLNIMLASALAAAIAAVTSLLFSHQLARRRHAKNVFIIYAREDIESAKNLALLTREAGLNPWLDIEQLLPGQVWKKEVLKALEESSVAVVVVSKNIEKNGFVREELSIAMKLLQSQEADTSPIVPVRIDDSAVPEQLAQIQWVDLREEGAEEKLLQGLSFATGLTLELHGPFKTIEQIAQQDEIRKHYSALSSTDSLRL